MVGRREVGLGRQARGELVHARGRGSDARAAREVGEQRLARARVALLRQVPDGQGGRAAPDRAAVRNVEAGEELEQRRLAGAVRPDEPDPCLGRHDEIDVREDDLGSMRFRDACGGEHCGPPDDRDGPGA